MEEAVKKKKEKKGKSKGRKGKKKERTQDEMTELQERRSLSSPEADQDHMEVKETAFPATESVEEVRDVTAVPRKSIQRSDSELTSIVVVGDDDGSTNIKVKGEEAPEKTQADIPMTIPTEEMASPRRKATLSRLDSAASLAKEETEDLVQDVSIAIEEEAPKSKPEETVVQEIKDVDRDINVDEIVQMEEKLDMKPKAEGPVTKAVSFSEKVEDMEEGETLRRNPLPAEAPESIGGESSILKPPSLSQKQSEAFLETEGSKTSQEDSIILDDASESVPWEMYRYIQKEEREEEDTDFEEYDGQKVGDGLTQSEDLPDIDSFANDLENEESGLGAGKPPPMLYDNLQQKEMHKYVEDLRQTVADEEIAAYLVEFERKVEDEIIEIGDISLEDVQEEERCLREEHIAFRQREARIERDRQKEIMLAMENAKKHVMTLFRQKCKLVLMRQEHLMQKDRLLQDRIHRSFRRSENHLLRALSKRMGEVKTMYGDLVFAEGQYDGSKCRRWKVDWLRTPQPIQIKLKCLRGMKNKLPGSRYVLMATLYSRLGGHVMKWSNLKGQQWGGSTLPMNHDGKFFNIELKIDQSVFAVCPSRPDMKSGMVLVFELLILRGAVSPTDKVVGWGCFPICDGNFNISDGRHKTPLLRGSMDSSIDKFGTVEKLIASDIDHWLCNLYFEIVKLPKYLAGQKEYEIELQFTDQTSKLLSNGVMLSEKPAGDAKEFSSSKKHSLEKQIPPSILASTLSIRSSKPPPPYSEVAYDNAGYVDDAVPGPSNMENLTIDVPAMPQRKLSDRSASPTPSTAKLRKSSNVSTDVRHRKVSKVTVRHPDANAEDSRPFTVYGSRKVVEEHGVYLNEEDSSSESDYSGDEVIVVGKDSGLKPIDGQPGIFYKVRQRHMGEDDSKSFYTMLPKTPLLAQQKKKKKLTHLEDLEQYAFSIKTKWSGKDSMLRKGQRRMRYVQRMLPVELDLWQYKSKEFWSMMLVFVITFWIRLYLHYVGQWVLLQAQSIPIDKMEYLPYSVRIFYPYSILRTEEAIGLIVVGPFSNLIVLVTMILFTYFFQTLFDRFPNLCSRFIIAFGIQATLDPLWILLVDTAMGRFKNLGANNPIGDSYQLYYHFSRFYGNGAVTLFISVSMTIFLYAVSFICGCIILYLYFMRLHNNGRMMDIYWRLHGLENSFFLPYDLELSNEELGYICRKAEKWRGQEGEQRKISVYHYTWEEEEVAEEEWDNARRKRRKTPRQETITHISIHTVHLDGLRQLYRHFLKLSNGAIVEVFGEVNLQESGENSSSTRLRKRSSQDGSPQLGRINRSYSASSSSSINEKERRPSQFLDLPPMVT